MTQKWTQADIPDLTGKVIVITGANSGLGFECAKTFAEKGATVVMTARNLQKGESARAEILQAWPDATVNLMQLDVGDLRSVRAFAPRLPGEVRSSGHLAQQRRRHGNPAPAHARRL
jgi:NAD(P)-dependent dehydrogenase (short-subunit alcohol dehydrogenase family)